MALLWSTTRRNKMTKVFFISAILALGFGPTVYAVLFVFEHIARRVAEAVTGRGADFLVAFLLAHAGAVFFDADMGIKRYFIAAVATLAAYALNRYKR
jgi:glucan phosphoethanolaminetransferase (alkaline phosphatase superfamily)